MDDILSFAMKMELDGKAFYERGAAAAPNPELQKILLTLAEEEEKHFRVFRSLKEAGVKAAEKAMGGKTRTPALARNLFQQMVAAGTKTLYGEDAKSLWKEAIKIEEKSEKLYRDQASAETDESRKALLNRIADEERNHIYLIDNMIQFMADPGGFQNSAQYKNFMSWEGH